MTEFKEWLPVLANLAIAAFIYGGLSQQVKNLTKGQEKQEKSTDAIWSTVGRHGERISTLEGKVGVRANGAAAGR